MSFVDAWTRLGDACEAVEGIRVIRRPGVTGDPPCVYVPPPALTWDGYVDAPTEAVFEVVLAVRADAHAIERLFDLLPLVTEALDGAENAVVKEAEPSVWRVGTAELPCYLIRTEVSV
jgi:hypothetical protein